MRRVSLLAFVMQLLGCFLVWRKNDLMIINRPKPIIISGISTISKSFHGITQNEVSASIGMSLVRHCTQGLSVHSSGNPKLAELAGVPIKRLDRFAVAIGEDLAILTFGLIDGESIAPVYLERSAGIGQHVALILINIQDINS